MAVSVAVSVAGSGCASAWSGLVCVCLCLCLWCLCLCLSLLAYSCTRDCSWRSCMRFLVYTCVENVHIILSYPHTQWWDKWKRIHKVARYEWLGMPRVCVSSAPLKWSYSLMQPHRHAPSYIPPPPPLLSRSLSLRKTQRSYGNRTRLKNKNISPTP